MSDVYKPEDTTKRDPWVHLLGSLSDGPSGYIEAMEKQGQDQMVHSEVLPRLSAFTGEEHQREKQAFLDLGFTFGDEVDDLFWKATIPDGWKREGSEHDMWSYIVDERGIRRVAIFFYKAAFYDRRAFMRLCNVGYDISSKFIYGEPGDPDYQEEFVLPEGLTDGEVTALRSNALDYAQKAEEDPHIYGDRLWRVDMILHALNAHDRALREAVATDG